MALFLPLLLPLLLGVLPVLVRLDELPYLCWCHVSRASLPAIVVVVVLIVALILWALDRLFAWIIASLIG